MKLIFTAVAAIGLAATAAAAGLDDLIAQVKSAGTEGRGSADAAAAWAELSRKDASAVVPLLAALDDAPPVAANWIRSAVDAIVERAKNADKPLPAKELAAFLADKRHSGPARRLAFELLCATDPAARDRLLPTFLNDLGQELRFDAVQTAFEKAKALPKEDAAANADLHKLLAASRNFAQAKEIADELGKRGDKVNVTDHFGFLKRWLVLASFDNSGGKGFQTAYPPEAAIDLKAAPAGKSGEPAKWYPAASEAEYAVVDLNKLVGKVKNAVAYAYAEVESADERDVEFRVASATAVKVFANGREVLARESYHQSSDPDSHIGAGRLKKGKNVIVMKVCQNDQKEPWAQEWQFTLRVTDNQGAKVSLKEVTPEKAG